MKIPVEEILVENREDQVFAREMCDLLYRKRLFSANNFLQSTFASIIPAENTQ